MTQSPPHFFNPCSLEENDQIPAKIWELLRRNRAFRDLVQRLTKLDSKERNDYDKTGKYHGAAWEESWQLVGGIKEHHPFAGVALQWLVPDPLFHCTVVTRSRDKKWIERVGEGTTPNINDEAHWSWRNSDLPNVGGHSLTRGPEVYWTKSRFKQVRSWVNPILEWKRYPWPFTVEHSWRDAPAQFRREFHFIWRRQFDCRPTNPLTKSRTDSPAPRETKFFHDWDLATFQASGQMKHADLYQIIRFNELADNYRVFAIPKTILTKASADAMGKWLADELKKGSNLYGDLLKGRLLNDGEMFGTKSEWSDWLPHHAGLPCRVAKDTHFYRRCRYMDSLVGLTFPEFDISKLLARPPHRARGKEYVRK